MYRKDILFWNHFKSLFCYVSYAFHSSDVSWSVNLPLFDYSWQQYFENKLVASPYRLSLMNDSPRQGKGLFCQNIVILCRNVLKKRRFRHQTCAKVCFFSTTLGQHLSLHILCKQVVHSENLLKII